MFDPSEVIGGRVNRNHNLATINGTIAMAYQGQTPWHLLGKRVNGMTSVEQALAAGNVDWTVSTRPTYFEDPTAPGKFIKIEDRNAVIRDGENVYLATVGTQYTPIQNRPGFMVLQSAVEKYGLTIESVGAIGKGERVWMLCKMKDVLTPVEGDDIRGYMLVTCVHDGTGSYIVKPTPIRAVCQNTLAVALASGQGFIRLQHKKTQAAQLEVVEQMVLQAHDMMEKTGQTYADMAKATMNLQDLGKFIETVLPTPEGDTEPSEKLTARRNTIAKLTFFGKGAQMAGSNVDTGTTTAWAAYNAITEYVDHVRPAEAIRPSAKAAATQSAIFGSGDVLKQLALKQAMEYAYA